MDQRKSFSDCKQGDLIVIAGCGGGFDIVAGLPVALRLQEEGHRVHLANYCVGAVTAILPVCSS